jgi:hypothetical protein
VSENEDSGPLAVFGWSILGGFRPHFLIQPGLSI